jgi:hypothetical protein
MKKFLLLALAPFIFLACEGIDGTNGKYVFRLQFRVQEPATKVVIGTDPDDSGHPVLTWEEGDALDFSVDLMVPAEIRHTGVFDDSDYLFRTKGRFALENGVWNTYVLKDGKYVKADDIEVVSSMKEGDIMVDFNYDRMGKDIPSEDWFSVRYHRTLPFVAGETSTLDLSDIFAKRVQ